MPDPNLPPGQQLAAPGRWPPIGERAPRPWKKPWRLLVDGAVWQPTVWSIDELKEIDTCRRTIDIHCVTRWSKLGVEFEGVPLSSLLHEVRPAAMARYANFAAHSMRDHTTSLPLADLHRLDALVAWAADGEPLSEIHGGPLRLVVPGRYFYKSLKWLTRVELMAEDDLGYWESTAGYHNHADPWREERYMAPALDRAEARRRLADRDFAGADLRSIDAADYGLDGLRAAGALLRDADFRRARLRGASFDRANLSNAHFDGADLREASFVEADLEGASLVGADLRGANFTGALLTAVTFFASSGEAQDAQLDAATRIDPAAIEHLMPDQADRLRRALG